MAKNLSKESYKKLLDSCSENCDKPYCFYKELLQFIHTDPRTLCQVKIIEKMKWIWSKERGSDVGWQESGLKWVQDGYAEIFAATYDPDVDAEENYRKLIAIKNLPR